MSAAERLGQVRDGEGLHSAIRMLRRHWLLVAGVVLACVVIGVARH